MSGQISTFIAAMRAAMAATFTDLKPDGIYQYSQVELIPWENLTPPYGVIVCEWTATTGWGGANFPMRSEVQLIRVRSVTGEADLMTLYDEMESLWRYLIDNRPTTVNLLSFPSLGLADDINGNETFADKASRFRAGRLVAEVLMGYNP